MWTGDCPPGKHQHHLLKGEIMHPLHHEWLFSIDAIECCTEMADLRNNSIPKLESLIPDDWLEMAIDIAMTVDPSLDGQWRNPKEIAYTVWLKLRPPGTSLFVPEKK